MIRRVWGVYLCFCLSIWRKGNNRGKGICKRKVNSLKDYVGLSQGQGLKCRAFTKGTFSTGVCALTAWPSSVQLGCHSGEYNWMVTAKQNMRQGMCHIEVRGKSRSDLSTEPWQPKQHVTQAESQLWHGNPVLKEVTTAWQNYNKKVRTGRFQNCIKLILFIKHLGDLSH